MKSIKWVVIIALLCITNSKAQGFAIQIGYANIGTNHGYIGLDARLSEGDSANIGAGSYATVRNGKLELLPEIHLNMKSDSILALLEISTAINFKIINPSIGINLLNFLKIKTGYCFPTKNSGYFKGVTFGTTIALGTNGYYDKLKFM